MRKIIPLLSLIMSSAFAQENYNSYVPFGRLLKAKGYQLEGNAEIFSSSKRIGGNGESLSFNEGESFQRLQGSVMGYYGATNDLQFGVGIRFRQNQAKFFDNSNEVTATGTGLESTVASIKYAFKPVDRMHYVLEGMFRYRPYTNDEYVAGTSDPEVLILGDIGNEISLGAAVTYAHPRNNFISVRAGYRMPGTDLANEIYWQVEGAMVWRYFALVAGVDGASTMGTDPFDGKGNRPIYNTGGTYLYNSSKREWITPYAGMNIGLGDSWRVELRGSQVVAGNSTDIGTNYSISLVKRSERADVVFVDTQFKTYDLEATVTKVSGKKELVIIDKGMGDDFEKGMKVDLFEFDYVGGNVLVASGVIVQAKTSSAIVRITQRYNKKKDIKEGLIVRGRMK